jgi:hypothetical protein
VAFSPDGRTILTAAADGVARLWPVPKPSLEDEARWRAWLKVVSGMELDANESTHTLTSEEWSRARQAVERLGGPPRE